MTVDPRQRARELVGVHEAVLCGDAPAAPPRPIVLQSWQRSLAARIDPELAGPPMIFEHTEVGQLRQAHPLASIMPVLRETLSSVADEARFMVIMTDAQGHILWRDGQRDVLRHAEPVGLVEGTRWSEDSIGTNAMGTALAADRAVQIHSAEHLVRVYHSWTCAACPVHDPDTGEVIGAVDVTGPVDTFHPTTLALVVAAVKLAETELARALAVRDERLLERNLPHLAGLHGQPGALLTPTGRVLAAQPADWVGPRVTLPAAGDRVSLGAAGEGVLEPLADGWLLRPHRAPATPPPMLALRFLGTAHPQAHVNGRTLRLSLRHAEILALLAMHPAGLSADELATAQHGDTGKSVTVRAEIHRLRAEVGAAVLRTQPYRVDARVDADFLEVRSALAEGRVRDAVRLHTGPLLPRSEAPAVREERELLAAAVRRAVLTNGDAEALWALAQTTDGAQDVQLTERLLHVLPASDPRRAVLSARLSSGR